jgi:benzoyl-CoA reductase/2-hydroxyglutaryl-CoA dehydratase subunit BcrC/BadD/HgdB
MPEPGALQKLVAAGRAPLAQWPAHYPGRQAVGYLCSYVPEEMIHAAGFNPVRVRGIAAPLRQVDAHLQSFACALCRSTLDQLLDGKLRFLRGTVFAHTCDALQAQADLWRMNAGEDHFVEVLMQPANLGTSAARPFLLSELSRIWQQLLAYRRTSRPLTRADLQASIRIYDETRRRVQALQTLGSRLSTADYYAIMDAVQVMPREEANPLLAQLLEEVQRVPPRPAGARLYLVGAVLDEPRLLELIDGLGAQVCGDDLCSGSRHFHGQVGSKSDPLGALADYYLERPPCPAKYAAGHEAGQYLVERAQAVGSDGVVFVVEKFCESHAFDYALALPALEAAGLPHMMLEMEQTPSLEALRTRLQAFVEML